MTLDADEFLRRFLQHVLPSGFQKVRHYGFLSANSRVSIESVRWLVSLCYGLLFVLRATAAAPTADARAPSPTSGPRCAECGGALRVLYFLAYEPPRLDSS